MKLPDNESRVENLTTLRVDEHIWHHVDPRRWGPMELTRLVDLTRDNSGKARARLPDLVSGRSGKAYAPWLSERGHAFGANATVAALDPFAGDKTAIDATLDDPVVELDAFHVVELGAAAVDEIRRVQHDILGHCGRKSDQPFGIPTVLGTGCMKLTD